MRRDAVAGQNLLRLTGILCSHTVGDRESPECADRDIGRVSDRQTHDVESPRRELLLADPRLPGPCHLLPLLQGFLHRDSFCVRPLVNEA